MFNSIERFNQDLTKWDVSKVENSERIFGWDEAFDFKNSQKLPKGSLIKGIDE